MLAQPVVAADVIARLNADLAYANDAPISVEVQAASIENGLLENRWLQGTAIVKNDFGSILHEEDVMIRSGSRLVISLPTIEDVGTYEITFKAEGDGQSSRTLSSRIAVVYPPEQYSAGWNDGGKQFIIHAGSTANLTVREWLDYGTESLISGKTYTLANDTTLEINTPIGRAGLLGVRYDVVDQWGWSNHALAMNGELRGPPHSFMDPERSGVAPYGEWTSGMMPGLIVMLIVISAGLVYFRPEEEEL